MTRHLHTTHRSSPPWFLPTLKLFSLDSSMYGTAITLSLALLLACSFNVSPLPRPADSAGAPSGVVVVVLPGVAFASVFFPFMYTFSATSWIPCEDRPGRP